MKSIKPVNRHLWLLEPLEGEATLLVKSMFGCKAVYLDGRMVLCLADKDEPWRGVLVPMEREHQPAVIADRAALAPHPILPKWLYLSEGVDSFEADAQWLVQRIRRRDPRIGIIPPSTKRKPRRDFNP
jgi:hypothetical protein